MQLYTIPDDRSEILGEFGPQNHSVSLKIAQRQRNHLSHNLVQMEHIQHFPTFSMMCIWLTAGARTSIFPRLTAHESDGNARLEGVALYQ